LTVSEDDIYKVPGNYVTAELKVKKSRFISQLFRVRDKEEAEEKYTEIKKQNYNATHNCFAYRINEHEFRYSDDGEPSGTAGKPILAALDGKPVLEVLCVVTRYFGGTKLGTGGLIRAYADAANLALDQVVIKRKIRSNLLKLSFGYEMENTVRKLINDFNGRIQSGNYLKNIEMEVTIPHSQSDLFVAKIIEVSNNQIKIEK
jgi:uncharacterized YigZ family protein